MLYPLKFEPIFKPRIWGGRRLEALFGKPLPAGQTIGESWELSGLPGDESVVANGPLSGSRLTDLVNRLGPALLGPAPLSDGQFPLLVKLLDARQALSVQVHPGRASPQITQIPAILENKNQSDPQEIRPKNECWYIIDAEPGARIWIGLNDGVDRERFAAAVRTGQVEPLLHVQPVCPGDFFYLPAGTVHALGAGIVVAEVQTPSDTTYRLFDWNRIDAATGRPRALHVDEALEVMDFSPWPMQSGQGQGQGQGDGCRLLACPNFTVDKIRLPGEGASCEGRVTSGKEGSSYELRVASDQSVSTRNSSLDTRPFCGGAGRMIVWQILSGGGTIHCRDEDSSAGLDVEFAAGELLLMPAEMPPATVSSPAGCELLQVTPWPYPPAR